MGLGQIIKRPRNYGHFETMMADNISITETGEFLTLGRINTTTNRASNEIYWPYDIVIKRIWMGLLSTSLDGASVNTVTLQLNAVDSALVLTFTDASPVNTTIESVADVLVPANTRCVFIWESNSVGGMIIRVLGMAFTAVGLP